MSKILNTSGEFYFAIFGENLLATYTLRRNLSKGAKYAIECTRKLLTYDSKADIKILMFGEYKINERISKNLTEILFHDLMIKDHEPNTVRFP